MPVAYVSLYRRYRPQSFADIVGQEHVVRTLRNAVLEDRLHHAYLFTGPRGTGKTSTARILAKALNCEAGPTPDPCGVCVQCEAITAGTSVDVIELDMASHGGVDDARELRDRALFAPASARRKVYVLDEVHMASTAAFNALLKLIEEPPPHVLFAMATTDPQKVLPTILSRVQRLDLRRVSAADVAAHVRRLCEAEGYAIEPAAVEAVVRAGDGSVRDTLSVLEQVLAFAGTEVTAEAVGAVLGHSPADLVVDTIDRLAAGDLAGLLGIVQGLLDEGHDLRRFTLDLVQQARDLLVLGAAPDRPDLVDATDERRARLVTQAAVLAPATLLRMVELLSATVVEQRTGSPRLPLERALARLALPAADGDLSALAARVAQLEQQVVTLVAGGAVRTGPPMSVGSDAAPAEAPTRSAPAEASSDARLAARARARAAARQSASAAAEPDAAAPGTAEPPAGPRPAGAPAGAAGEPPVPADDASAPASDVSAPVDAELGPPADAEARPAVAAPGAGGKVDTSVVATVEQGPVAPSESDLTASAPEPPEPAPSDVHPSDAVPSDAEPSAPELSDTGPPGTAPSDTEPAVTSRPDPVAAPASVAGSEVTDDRGTPAGAEGTAAPEAFTDAARVGAAADADDPLGRIREHWPTVLEQLKQGSRKHHAMVEPATLVDLHRGVLRLRYPRRYASFHAVQARSAPIDRALRDAIAEVCGVQVRLEVLVEGDDERRRPVPPSVTPDDARTPVLDPSGPSPAPRAPSGPTTGAASPSAADRAAGPPEPPDTGAGAAGAPGTAGWSDPRAGGGDHAQDRPTPRPTQRRVSTPADAADDADADAGEEDEGSAVREAEAGTTRLDAAELDALLQSELGAELLSEQPPPS